MLITTHKHKKIKRQIMTPKVHNSIANDSSVLSHMKYQIKNSKEWFLKIPMITGAGGTCL